MLRIPKYSSYCSTDLLTVLRIGLSFRSHTFWHFLVETNNELSYELCGYCIGPSVFLFKGKSISFGMVSLIQTSLFQHV